MYNLIEYSGDYLKTSVILWPFCRDVLAVVNDSAVTDFIEANAITDSFKVKLAGQNRQKWYRKCWNNGTIKISK